MHARTDRSDAWMNTELEHPADPCGNQRTAATQRAANLLTKEWYWWYYPRQSISSHCQLPLPQAKKVNTTYQDSQASLGIYGQWWATNRSTYCNDFSPLDPQQQAAFSQTTTAQQEHHQQPAQSASSAVSRCHTAAALHLPSISHFQEHCCQNLKVFFRTTWIFQKQLIATR